MYAKDGSRITSQTWSGHDFTARRIIDPVPPCPGPRPGAPTQNDNPEIITSVPMTEELKEKKK